MRERGAHFFRREEWEVKRHTSQESFFTWREKASAVEVGMHP
jgi:hypothetical protein